MADKNVLKQKQLERRKFGIRKTLSGSAERPRLSVFRSDKHIYAQIIDDMSGKTLVAASSMQADVRGELKNGGNIEARQASRHGDRQQGSRLGYQGCCRI